MLRTSCAERTGGFKRQSLNHAPERRDYARLAEQEAALDSAQQQAGRQKALPAAEAARQEGVRDASSHRQPEGADRWGAIHPARRRSRTHVRQESPARHSAVLEPGGALFDKGSHAFFLVVQGK